jgi:3-deoxy-D-manno-octulosonic-acid transferase
MYFLYSCLSLALFVLVSPYFVYQALRYNKYVGSLGQRLGFLPVSFNLDGDRSIWIHAVSVGEVLTARALVADLKARHPALRLFVSTTTMTGQRVARTNLQGVDAVFFFPFDFGFIVHRTLRLVRPRLFIMMETEIWPNLLRACRRQGVKTLLVNGRISSRSYPRYRLARPFFRRVLADVDRFCMQSEESARRLVDIGADPEKVVVTGSLKFDSLEAPGVQALARGPDRVLRFFRVPEARPVVMAASTLKGEEEAVLTAFRQVQRAHAGALLVIAPRKPERFDEVENLVRQEGFSVARRTELAIDAEPRTDVVVLDTIGELARLFQIATVVFVGGSLVDAGGHNILEPAVFGKPILFGPHMQNFAEIARAFLESRAGLQVASARELEEAILGLLADPSRRSSLGAAARALVEANRGAKGRSLAVVDALLPASPPAGVVRQFRRAT